ncbi:hypothetical protein SAMN05216466_116106 [Paraburkholderia phenazinium]|uniref:Phosphohydrolase n=1 Tax=Paraburkholderia phenazinium TaxID=60549 RepID=A0A1G8HDH4_9BURK|nr:phosphohydrolase [Paraburkholderia phenazinium]SDI04693.1 hypothetical protein SAMN05216466_116106 [Paraburkholderia phenazinium]
MASQESAGAGAGRGSLSRKVCGIGVPQGELAREAHEVAGALLPGVLSGHAQRVFILAALKAQRGGVRCNTERLYVASMFINVGLSAAYLGSQRRYEVDSADAARQFLARHGVAASAATQMWHAVALHTSHGIAKHASTLAALLAAGVRTDLFGEDLAALPRESEAELLRAYPRGERFKEQFIHAIGQGVAHRPGSTFGTLSADVLERLDPDYRRINYCGLILGAKWQE